MLYLQVNHRFRNTNVDFDFVTSPRFGETRCLRSTRLIKRGEELFVDYDYDMNQDVPSWYLSLHKATFGNRKRRRSRRKLAVSRFFQ